MTNQPTYQIYKQIYLSNRLGLQGSSGGVMVSKLDKQTFTSEFKFHWVTHSFGLVPHPSKKLSKLQ